LQTTTSTKLRLFSVAVHSEKSFIGVRGWVSHAQDVELVVGT
jgi:hypothetical protein